jgi:tetratricopeptide (TPR) repeat protein
MDIDEFLDREAVEIDNAGKVSESQDRATESQEETKPADFSFDEINGHVEKGDFEKAEQAYFQMWNSLMQNKLKWDKGLYDNLLASSRQFSVALARAYAEAKKKSDMVQAMIGKARTSLREGKKDLSFKTYSEISKLDSSIPNVFFEEKKLIWEHMMELYRDLKAVTDNDLMKRVSGLIAEINVSLDRISVSMSSKDTKEAAKHYNRCIELYSQIPEGFLMHKNSVGMKILDAYRLLSIQSEISSLQLQLNVPQMQRPQYTEAIKPHNIMPTPLMEKELSTNFRKQQDSMQKKEGIPATKTAMAKNNDTEETFRKLKSYSQ